MTNEELVKFLIGKTVVDVKVPLSTFGESIPGMTAEHCHGFTLVFDDHTKMDFSADMCQGQGLIVCEGVVL